MIKHGNTRRGGLRTREYTAWLNMKARCLNKNNPAYKYYGGRGITICDRWKYSFINFIADMGQSGGLTLDRINNNGNYEPSNCRWASIAEQAVNRRDNRIIFYKGKRTVLSVAIRESGLQEDAYTNRKKLGWSDERIFSTPVGPYRRKAQWKNSTPKP